MSRRLISALPTLIPFCVDAGDDRALDPQTVGRGRADQLDDGKAIGESARHCRTRAPFEPPQSAVIIKLSRFWITLPSHAFAPAADRLYGELGRASLNIPTPTKPALAFISEMPEHKRRLKTGQMISTDEVLHTRRQQQRLVDRQGPERLAHKQAELHLRQPNTLLLGGPRCAAGCFADAPTRRKNSNSWNIWSARLVLISAPPKAERSRDDRC